MERDGGAADDGGTCTRTVPPRLVEVGMGRSFHEDDEKKWAASEQPPHPRAMDRERLLDVLVPKVPTFRGCKSSCSLRKPSAIDASKRAALHKTAKTLDQLNHKALAADIRKLLQTNAA